MITRQGHMRGMIVFYLVVVVVVVLSRIIQPSTFLAPAMKWEQDLLDDLTQDVDIKTTEVKLKSATTTSTPVDDAVNDLHMPNNDEESVATPIAQKVDHSNDNVEDVDGSKHSSVKPPSLSLDPPSHKKKHRRILFGIFSMDRPNERDLRQAHRDTYLQFYKHHQHYATKKKAKGTNTTNSTANQTEERQEDRDTICSLTEWMEILSSQPTSTDDISFSTKCRFVYTFVMGGGNPDTKPDRCVWEDPDCVTTIPDGGAHDMMNQWTMPTPDYNYSDPQELRDYNDVTFLSTIRENHELGKTDTWFTYMAGLTHEHPELGLDFVGKLDSDTVPNIPLLFHLFTKQEKNIVEPCDYIYAGELVPKEICVGDAWGKACLDPLFTAPYFVPGALVYLSTLLIQHVFMTGTTLTQKRQIWMPAHEDMQLGNMAYADPNQTICLLKHKKRFTEITNHPYKTPTSFRIQYGSIYRLAVGGEDNGKSPWE